MQRDNVAFLKERLEVYLLNTGNILLRTIIAKHLAAEGLSQFHRLAANGTKADNTERLAGKLKAQKAFSRFLAAHGRIAGRQFAVKTNGQPKDKFADGFIRIAGTVRNDDVFPTAVIHGHMVHTGKSNTEEFYVGAF